MSVGYTAEELALWSGGEWVSSQPKRIVGVAKDTRTIGKNELYIAIKGERFDGHDYVENAMQLGACGAVVERAWYQEWRGKFPKSTLLVVEDSMKALADMASAYRDKVDPEIIGVTGSAGKSTVKEMIAQILAVEFKTANTFGNWNNNIGLPMSLLNMDSDTEKGVFEVGTNHPGEIAELCAILKPDWGVVTNVGPVHIEFFDSVEAIVQEKSELLRSLPENGTAVLNADDDSYGLVRKAVMGRSLVVSELPAGDYSFVVIKETGKVLVKELFSGEEMLFSPVIPGKHNILNALMAVAIARGQNMKWQNIRIGLEKFKSLPMRWEEVRVGEIRMINDAYNANPLSMRASINAFEEESVDGDKWLVLAGMGELGRLERGEHIQLGEYVGEGDWGGIVLVGGFGEMIAKGIQTTGYDLNRVYMCVNNDEAAEVLEKNIHNGDAVLLKASRSMRLEEVVETVQRHLE